ncbi:hypothetical protein GQ457_01G000260 [Hibiscus cannabinus]
MAGFGPENGAVASQSPETPAVFEVSKKPKKNKFSFACAMLASLTSMLLGYDIGVMSGAIMFIKEDLRISDVRIEILVGVLNLYCLVGSIVAGKVADWIGRRYTMVLANVCINVGMLFGYVSNYAFSKLPLSIGWRLMLGIGAIPSVFLVFAVLAMPESPRWLVMQGRLGEAKIVLEKTLDTKEEAQLRLNDIKEAAGIRQDCVAAAAVVPKRLQRRRHGGVASDARVFPNGHRPFGSETNLGHRSVHSHGSGLRGILRHRNGSDHRRLHVGDLPLEATCVGVSMGVAVNRVTSGVISMTFISLYEAITIGGAFFLFGGIATVGWVFFYVCLPETRGKTLEETGKLFGKLGVFSFFVIKGIS